MRKIILILLCLSAAVIAQTKPSSYLLGNERIGKVSETLPKSNTILDIRIDNDLIWLGTSRGVSKSADNGNNWTNYYKTNDFGEESIIALNYVNGVVYAATGHSTEKIEQTLPEGSGLKVSFDNGANWISTPQSRDGENDTTVKYGVNTLRALPVTVNTNNISYDIAVVGNYVYTANFAGGLRRTSDNGTNWERVVLPPDYLDEIHPDSTYSFSLQPVSGAFGNENNLNHRVFSVVTINDSTLAVGTAGGINIGHVFESGDIYWRKSTRTNQDKPISGNFITAMGWDESSSALWAATWKAEGISEYYAVSVSFDTAKTWQIHLIGERPHNFGFKNYKVSGTVKTDVFIGTDNGIFRSNDVGETWLVAANIVDEKSGKYFDSKEFYSADHYNFNGTDYIYIGSAGGGLLRFEETGDYWTGKWNVYTASEELNSLDDTYAFPNPFSPSQESIKIKYKLDATRDVTIRIMDFGMNLVKTVIQNVQRNGGSEYLDEWDGRDEFGNVVSNGVYFYRIDAGDDDPVFGKIMVLR